MQKVLYPKRMDWAKLSERPQQPVVDLEQTVKGIFDDVEKNGDLAVLNYTQKYDWPTADRLQVNSLQIEEASTLLPTGLKNAIALASKNIETFHGSQQETCTQVETTPGVICWRESRPIDTVGIYIPGGTAPLFSTVLMLAIPARLAGCKNIVLCTPPDSNGNINPAVLYAAKITGVTSVFTIGGIQAIAAMTLGTESVPKVDKLFGPGNQYVTAAKTYAQRYGMCIDLPAGPSEVLVIADKTAIPSFVAADLLSQAEHGIDSQVMLVSNDELLVNATMYELEKQLVQLLREDIAHAALKNSKAIVLNELLECIEFSNVYAPEHLIVAIDRAAEFTRYVTNAGSVFLGNYSCESAGDYASGTNHTLPTNGHARSYNGVSLDSFIKKITFQSITKEGINGIGPAIELMAEAEGLLAHKRAVTIRLNYSEQQ